MICTLGQWPSYGWVGYTLALFFGPESGESSISQAADFTGITS
jgi:hypothetical protein